MRLFHTSDTHLGHQQYPRTDAQGLNQREQDIYAAWHKVIDAAVAERPDAFLHAGDLFDGVRPGNRALAHAMEGFLKLSRAGIPTFVIAGNHEHPRLRETGSPMRLFEHLPNVHVAYRGALETHCIETPSGELRIHAVPQCADQATLAAEVASAKTEQHGFDVLVAHGSVPSLPAFSHAEFNEQTLDAAWFAPFDYVALGHYHGVQQVAPNAWYCGAPERVSIAESGQEKGFLDIRLADADVVDVRLRALDGRTYMDLPALRAEGLDAAAVAKSATEALQRVPAGAVARLRIVDLDPSLRGALDVRAIRQAATSALHLDLRFEWQGTGLEASGAPELRGMLEEFEAFAAQQPLGAQRDRVLGMARRLLA
jgi:DNA repair protein SbcD/Mre11